MLSLLAVSSVSRAVRRSITEFPPSITRHTMFENLFHLDTYSKNDIVFIFLVFSNIFISAQLVALLSSDS